MGLPNGVHHLAICTKDMKAQIEFFTQVLGMELVALYWMHGVKNTYHGFVRMNDSSSIAFVQGPESGGDSAPGGRVARQLDGGSGCPRAPCNTWPSTWIPRKNC